MSLSWQIETFKSLDSTQDYLIAQTSQASEGLIIHAIEQTKGRGRYDRIWEQGTGNLYASFLLKPESPASKIGQISLIMGLSLHQAISESINAKPLLKWPNDVLIEGKKCCGILIESSLQNNGKIEWLAIGFGVNIAAAPLPESCALNPYSGEPLEIMPFLQKTLDIFAQNYNLWQNEGFEPLRREWLKRSYRQGEELMVKIGNQAQSGQFETIDEDGNLVISQNRAIRKISAGDVYTN